MATRRDTSEGVRQILIETLEVQLAAMRAGIAFWADWANTASTFTEVASRGLTDITTRPEEVDQVLSEVTEASVAYWRALAERSERAVRRFQDELAKARKASLARAAKMKGSPRGRTRKKAGRTGRPTRSARAKD